MRSTPRADREELGIPARARRAGTRLTALLSLLAALVPTGAGIARADAAYLDELLARAREAELARDPTWRALVHYRRIWWRPGWRSQADDPRFFLDEGGPRDPQAELDATLRAFFAPEPASGEEEHPQCGFVARYRWLDEELGFDPARLTPRHCERFEAWRASLAPEGVTLVFPEAFMSNPASMFGHTLLRVDRTDARHDLLGWAINYAGATGEEGGIRYALKGIFGLYDGFFSIAPYHEMVERYGDWENRDIWEYPLVLSQVEVDRLLEHLWELEGIAFDYFYFDENCSQQLQSLLEVARPSLRGSDFVPPWVIPADTVRAVREDELVATAEYRASAETELRHAARQLSRSERRLARRVAAGEVPPEGPRLLALPDPRRAAVLDLAYDLLRYRFLAGEISRGESVALSRDLLVARSRVAVAGDAVPPIPTPATPPDQGHRSARLAFGAGVQDGDAFLEARIRPALHDLLDPPGGYLRGAQIQFADLALRFFPEDPKLRFHEAVLLDLLSLPTWDGILRPIALRFDTGMRTRLLPSAGGDLGRDPLWRTRGGLGLAAELGPLGLGWLMAEAVGEVGPGLRGAYALGPGASAGLLVDGVGERWRAKPYARVWRYAVGDRGTAVSTGVEQSLALGRDQSLELRTSYEWDTGRDWLEAVLTWKLYF